MLLRLWSVIKRSWALQMTPRTRLYVKKSSFYGLCPSLFWFPYVYTYFWNDRIVVLYRFPTKIADIGGLEAGEDDGGAHGLGRSLLDIHRGDKELFLASLNLWHFKINLFQPILPKFLCCLCKRYSFTQLFLLKLKKRCFLNDQFSKCQSVKNGVLRIRVGKFSSKFWFFLSCF